MKIAVTYDNGDVFQHFGRTEEFKVYNIEDNKVVSSEVVSSNGRGHGELVQVLKEINAEVLICGGIGEGARSVLVENGIRLYGGTSGNCDEKVERLLSGELEYTAEANCSHHEHEGDGEHNCGSHSCGNH